MTKIYDRRIKESNEGQIKIKIFMKIITFKLSSKNKS